MPQAWGVRECCRCGSDLILPRLWRGLAAAAPIQTLVGELPYTTGAALKRKTFLQSCVYFNNFQGLPIVVQIQLAVTNPTSIPGGHRFNPGTCSVGWVSGIAVSCDVGLRHGLDPELLWLWYRLTATAPIRPLAWELSYAVGAALKR